MTVYVSEIKDWGWESIPKLVADLKSGVIELANQPMEELLGIKARGGWRGKTVEQFIPEELRATHKQHRAAFAADPGKVDMSKGRVLKVLRVDGTQIEAKIAVCARVTEDGQYVAFVYAL